MPPRKKPDPELEIARILEAIATVSLGQNYTAVDRYRDFHEVFTSEAGKRVLFQIFHYCEGRPLAEDQVSEHGRLAFREGRDAVRWWIVKALVPPRADQPHTKGD